MSAVQFRPWPPPSSSPFRSRIAIVADQPAAVSLLPRADGGREVQEIVEDLRPGIEALPGPGRKSFTVLSGGPPTAKPINVKVRGEDYGELRRAVVREIPGARDIVDDDQPGRAELRLALDREAVVRSGLDAATVARLVRLQVDGEIVQTVRDRGEKVEARVAGSERPVVDVATRLGEAVALPGGGVTTLGALLRAEATTSKGNIKRYNFRRTITVEANLDKTLTDTVRANRLIVDAWARLRPQYPGVDLDFTGELDDIQVLYAARRRVIPVLITATTTIAGLFSLAAGLGGKSLLWGPVASAIVWGLALSTLLTLFIVPVLYSLFMRRPAAAPATGGG